MTVPTLASKMCLNLLHMRDAEDPRIVENLAQRPEAGKVGLDGVELARQFQTGQPEGYVSDLGGSSTTTAAPE